MADEQDTRSHSFTVDLPFRLTSALSARQKVCDLVGPEVASETVQDIELVVHELVVNAIAHGRPSSRGTIRLSCTLTEDCFVITVQDHGITGRIEPHPHSSHLPNGRGLQMVEGLSQSWSVTRSAHTVVEARIAVR